MTAPAAHEAPSRRARKKARTRQQIYAAGLGLFRERGYDGVTVEAICQAADVAKGTFFLHFPTKAALLFEYGARIARELARPRPGRPGDAAEELRWITGELVDRWLADAALLGRMLRALLAEPAALSAAPQEGRALAELIEAVVRRGQERGTFRPGIAPELAASVFLSSSLSFLSGALRAQPALGPEQIRDQFLDLILGGLVAPADPATHPEEASTRWRT